MIDFLLWILVGVAYVGFCCALGAFIGLHSE